MHDNPPRTAIYVKNTITATQIPLPLNDTTAIWIMTMDSNPTLIINIYKPCDERIIPEIHKHIQEHLSTHRYDAIIIAGDFNVHHPVWNPEGYTRHDEEADALIEMMAELNLNLLLPPGTITYPNAKTTIDLVWADDHTSHRVIKCQIAKDHDHGSDHLPIQTIIDLRTKDETNRPLPPYNYTRTNWKAFNNILQSRLPPPIPSNATKSHINRFAQNFVKAITETIQETTPRKKSSPHSKRWWNENLTKLQREANKLRNIYR